MAIESLEKRLDSIALQDQALPSTQAVNEGLDSAVEQVQMQPEPEMFDPEGVQVAGGPKVMREILRAPRRTTAPILPPGQDAGTVGPYQVIREAEPQAAEAVLQQAPMMPSSGKPSPKQPGVPATVTNLDNIVGPDELKQFIEASGRAAGADKLQRVSYKTIADQAKQDGYDESFIAGILDPAKATRANPTDAFKMLQAINDSGKVAFDLGEKVKQAKASGSLTPELAASFSQAVSVHGQLLSAARGRQADIARTLGVFRMARESTTQRGQMLEAILNESGGINSVHDLAVKYTALDSRAARANLAEKSISGRATDVWFSTWINGLLSNPKTHFINVASNMLFGAYQIPERFVGSLVGKARNTLLPGGEQAIQMDEVYAMAVGMAQGFVEGAQIAGRAFVKNEPTDALQKIESARAGRDTFAFDFGNSEAGRAMTNAVKYYGNFVTLPGRAMMAEDEFFTAIGYRMQLNALAARGASSEYSRLVRNGVPDAQAAQQAQALAQRILDPSTTPADIDDAAKEFGRVITFRKELEPSLQGMQRLLQTPLLKMFTPFVRTPTNIALEMTARTPLAFASPRFWSDFNAGGVRRDMAIGRATLGSGLIFTTAAFSLNGHITGYGPMRAEDKKVLEAQGWQPFSIPFKKSDVPPELLREFKKLATVSEGPDKYYISYAGLEPLGTLLAIGATAGEYSQMTPGDDDIQKMMLGGTLGIYQYLSDQPMLKGFSDIANVLSSSAKDAPSLFYDLLKQTSKQASTVLIGGSPLGAHSALVAGVERMMDPSASATMAPTMSTKASPMDGAVRGFWEAVQTAKSRNPLTSDSLPRSLDPITGEVRTVGEGNLYENFAPFRRSDGKFVPAYVVLREYGIPQFNPPRAIEGIQLSSYQYQRWIQIATEGGRLAKSVESLGRSKELVLKRAQNNLAEAQETINAEVSGYYSAAKQRLLAEDDELRQAVQDVMRERAREGKYKR